MDSSAALRVALHFVQVAYARRLRCHGETAARAWLMWEMPHTRIVWFLPQPNRAELVAQLQADAVTAPPVPIPNAA